MRNILSFLAAIAFVVVSFSQSETRQRYYYQSQNTDEEINLLFDLLKYNRIYKRAYEDHKGPATKMTYDENNAVFIKRMHDLKTNAKTAKQKRFYPELLGEFKQLEPDLVKDIDNPDLAKRDAIIETSNKGIIAAPTAPAATTTVATSAVRTPNRSGVMYTDSINCFQAGFPIEYLPCKPVTVLPEDYGLAELNEVAASFSCESPNHMCNPFLTGYKNDCYMDPHKKARRCDPAPVCVSKEGDTNIACLKASEKESSKKQIIALWKNPKNKFAYDYTKKALSEYCKPEKMEGSVKLTCQALQERFDELRMKAWPTGQPPAGTPSSRR